ncbi:Actin-like protein arp9 (SWI/SNF complex component arp9) [Recurvomyces mirabilis]|nr:Actin-like protein arp9 (SWI/SNF complex component arp9) [Recurvomyces mirabilis]
MPPFREDQLFIIAPGSETTLCQLGIPESFAPARHRLPSRMFTAQQDGEYEPIKIRRKERPAQAPTAPVNGLATNGKLETDGEAEWEEDHVSEEGAIWPIRNGRIVDWQCFYALMTHVYNTVNPPFHTPIILIAEPVWTTKEHERITQFFFEKFKVPAFTMVDSAMAASYAYGVTTATVIDIGHGKADVTCITDSLLHDIGRSVAVPDCAGEAMTERLVKLLGSRDGFTRNVCEQLKKSSICEVLPPDVDLPTDESIPSTASANPAAAASTGADDVGPGQRKLSVPGELPRGPGPNTQVGEEKSLEDNDGVLDIASIVTGGNMTEYLAKKEREKQERLAARQQKKGDAGQQAANKPARLQNNKRPRNTFVYEDYALHDAMKKAGMSAQSMVDMQSAMDEGPNKRQKTPEPQSASSDKPVDSGLPDSTSPTTASGFRREIEVGLERFQAASGGATDRLADAIYRTIQSCSDSNRRSELWECMIFVGNGGKVRGFKEALLETLQKKYIISPSSATIFTSELPSNLSTPMATGANTPMPQLPGQHHGQGVNPLLLAATTAQNPQLHPSSSSGLGQLNQSAVHFSHAQTPTSIKLAKIPEYFPEWKEVGYDEATFLGAQVAARVLFIADSAAAASGGGSKGYMSRTDYNESGPMGIHEVYL